MKVLFTGLVAVMVLFLVSSPSPGVIHEMGIPIDPGGALGGPLTDFPVMVKLNSGRVDYAQFQPDGSDLRFYQGATQLAHEIETFDTAGESFIWVKVPNVTSGETFTMKWGDTGGAPPDPTGVWSNGYIGVYHLNETAGTDIFDSTAAGNNGLVVDDPTVNGAGQINGGMTFTGLQNIGQAPTDDSINLGDVFDGLSAMTVEAWMNPATAPVRDYSCPLGKGDADDSQVGTTWLVETRESTGWIKFAVMDDDNNGVIWRKTDDGELVQGTWQHVASTWNGGTAGTDIKVYVDGSDVSLTDGGDGNFVAMRDTTDTIPTVIGAALCGTRYENFEGGMDEVRFSDVDRSADWLMASYLSDADNFLGWGDGPCSEVDWNDDGVIDDLDLTELAVHWQQSVPEYEQGDADGNGFVDDLDLTALAVCWPGGDLDVSAIPEPATLSLLALGGVALLRRKRS